MTKCPLTFLVCITLVASSAARAQSPAAASERVRKEAAERFDRGLALFEEGELTAALSEFKRAYDLVPSPVALFNLGLTYAALHRPVDAVDALVQVLADPTGLGPAQRELADATRRDQERRVARLLVETNVPAQIAVDGVELGHSPLSAPMRIAQGTHVVSATAVDRLERNSEITVAGGEVRRLMLELAATQIAAAQLFVTSRVPDARVRLDGVEVGITPLAASLQVEPGKHQVSAQRPGYVTQTHELDLPPGATGRTDFALARDLEASPADLAELELRLSEPLADVYIDDERQPSTRAPWRLPIGRHHVRVDRRGFEPVLRDVTLVSAQHTLLDIKLNADAETRAAYAASVSSQRTRAFWTLGAGAVLLAAGGTLAAVFHAKRAQAISTYNGLLPGYTRGSGGTCDPQQDRAVLTARGCAAALEDARADVSSHGTWRTLGFIGGGVGAAALLTGCALLMAADPHDRYELGAIATPQQVSATIAGRF